jgi:hypothetical protein
MRRFKIHARMVDVLTRKAAAASQTVNRGGRSGRTDLSILSYLLKYNNFSIVLRQVKTLSSEGNIRENTCSFP